MAKDDHRAKASLLMATSRIEISPSDILFLCRLAYYVKWHMSEAWRPLLFADGDSERLARRDPVAPATRSEEALAKASTKSLDEWGSRWVVRNAGQNPKRDRPL